MIIVHAWKECLAHCGDTYGTEGNWGSVTCETCLRNGMTDGVHGWFIRERMESLGIPEEAQCGGPKEACGITGCKECGAIEELTTLRARNAELEAELEQAMEIVKAVAHIGIDWGYGKFELTEEHISAARKLYEAKEQD